MTDRTYTLTVGDDGAVLSIKDATPGEVSSGGAIVAGALVRVGPSPTFRGFDGVRPSRAPEGLEAIIDYIDTDGDARLGSYAVSPRHLTRIFGAKPAPDLDLHTGALPTDPGLYADRDGDVWARRPEGWAYHGESGVEVDSTIDDPENYLPFRRIRPTKATA